VDIPVHDKEDSTPVHLMPCGVDVENDNGVAEAKVNCYFTSTMKKESQNGIVFVSTIKRQGGTKRQSLFAQGCIPNSTDVCKMQIRGSTRSRDP